MRSALLSISFAAFLLFTGRLTLQAGVDDPGYTDRVAGTTLGNSTVERDGKLIHPAGQAVALHSSPLDVALSPDGSMLIAKTEKGISLIDAKTLEVKQTLLNGKDFPGSFHGLAVTAGSNGDNCTIFVTSSAKTIMVARVGADGSARWDRKIPLPEKNPWGVAISTDGKTAYVCMSVSNTLAVVNLADGAITGKIPVGVCPYDVVLSPDGKFAFVTNYGGRHPGHGQMTEDSVGTAVAVDKRSIPISGTISKVDLTAAKVVADIPVGLHPNQIIRNAAGTRYFVGGANSDVVSVIDPVSAAVVATIDIKPDTKLPFGSIPDALSLSPDEKTLYVANAGNNAVAVVSLGDTRPAVVRGFMPTGWFPAGIVAVADRIFVSNLKTDDITAFAVPDPSVLEAGTKQVLTDIHVPQILAEEARDSTRVAPVPVPDHPSHPSLFKHVVFVLKENKTYDQVFGDIGKGNSDPKLCTYGRRVTPNQHALAEQFPLLDNYYCNAVNSSDGHQWATQGIIGEYFERGARTYDFGTDALCYAGCDFIWDSVLSHGLSFRNYGEFDFPTAVGKKNWFDIYKTWDSSPPPFKQVVQFQELMNYTCRDYPGWDLLIADACRMKVFMREFHQFEQSGDLPVFTLVYLPQDHTSGTKQTVPTPRAMVADNDLATGQVVDAISHSRFWKDTVIFINEDDPQSGYDHVDGHRSICMVVSPYSKRGQIVSHFYNQTSVLHTMTRIMGLPPLNQACAAAPTMEDCFTAKPDFTPFSALPNQIPLDERNKPREAMTPAERDLNDAVARMDFSKPDLIDEEKLNRLIWIESGSGDPFPIEFTGAHGRGLAALHLKLDHTSDSDGDDDGD